MRTSYSRPYQSIAAGVILAIVIGCAPRKTPNAPAANSNSSQLETIDLGSHSFPVSTKSQEAQKTFDRALTLAYAFSYDAAEIEFRRAAELDPQLAMAWWGVALVNGPHINFPLVPPERAEKAWSALMKAKELSPGALPLEQALIGTLEKRYAQQQPADRTPLDRAYAEALRKLWQQHSSNADIGTLFAESLMDLRPWDLWEPSGRPQPGTAEIAVVLKKVLTLNPKHPGANHLAVHFWETSSTPEKALPAAETLQTLVPGSGHLVHMPSHIFARTGDWERAFVSNKNALAADALFLKHYSKPGFYALYHAHNHHFLAFAAMMQGRSAEALKASRELVAQIPDEFMKEFGPVADGFLIFPSEVLMRFGKWKEILQEPKPRGNFPISSAMWHFTRGVAHTALGDLKAARSERSNLKQALSKLPKDAAFGNNSGKPLLQIALHMLDGEIAAKEDRFDAAVASRRRATAIEDKLRYDEPPDWIQPVRHTLGAVLLRAKRYKQAEKAYREDLKRFPENGWSLLGLSQALEGQNKVDEAKSVRERFAKAWSKADIQIGTTCLCQAQGG